MSKETPNRLNRVSLRWTGRGMEYVGKGSRGPAVILDGRSEKGPGPMDTLLLALAGCMAVDVQVVLEGSRVPLAGLEVDVEGERASDHPRRYQRVRLVYRVQGPGEEHRDRVDRAISMSREKLCSVLHTLRPDLDLEIEVHRV